MTYDEWFRSQQGTPYDGSYSFAKAAWEQQAARIAELERQRDEALAQVEALREFNTNQWWYQELLNALELDGFTDDMKRAVIGVIPNLIRQIHFITPSDALQQLKDRVREECAAECGSRHVFDDTREAMEAKRCAAAIREMKGKS